MKSLHFARALWFGILGALFLHLPLFLIEA